MKEKIVVKRIPTPVLDCEMPNTDFICTIYSQVIEGCLRELLTQYLGRPAQVEDGRRVTVGYFSDEPETSMLIALDGKQVGTLKVTHDFNKVTATFTPY